MSIRPTSVPPEVKKAVEEHIQAFLMPGDPSPHDRNIQRYWQRVVALGLQVLATANDVDKNSASTVLVQSQEAGWRYLIGTRSGQALYATVDSANKMTGLSRGTKVNTLLQAAGEIKTLPEAADADYDLILLTIPGLLTESFWLKSGDGKSDLIVPFFTSQELRSGHPYPAEKFLKIVTPLAQRQIASVKEVVAKEGSNPKTWEKEADLRAEAKRLVANEDEDRIRALERRLVAEWLQKKRQERHREEQQKHQKEICDRLELSKSATGGTSS